MRPESLTVPAYEVREPSQIPQIMQERGYRSPITGIDVIVQTEIRDPHNGKYKRPSILIEEYYMHVRVRTQDGREGLFTLDRKIIELYLTKKFDNVYHVDFSEPVEPGTRFPNLRRLRQRVRSHELSPSDENHALKVSCVIYRMLERLMEGIGERDASKYSIHVTQKGNKLQKMEIDANSCTDAREVARMIEFEPTQHIPEQIVDLTAGINRKKLV